MSQAFGKVAVLMGGASAEREISLLSGNAVLAALRRRGVDAHAFDPAQRDLWSLKAEGFARAFIALHGRGGEDGTAQGALETLGIPYTGSGVMASALCMDKWRTKMIWHASQLPTPAWHILKADTRWQAVADELGLPVFVKPAREGSSVGVVKVTRAGDLRAAYEAAAKHDPLVIAEQFIEGEELTAAFLGEQALPLVRVVAPGGNYDWQNKYFSDETQYFCPSGLPETAEETIQDLVMESARLLGCRGWGRVDLILDAAGKPWLLEMNTVPGMTGHSLVPMAAHAVGIDFDELCARILAQAWLEGGLLDLPPGPLPKEGGDGGSRAAPARQGVDLPPGPLPKEGGDGGSRAAPARQGVDLPPGPLPKEGGDGGSRAAPARQGGGLPPARNEQA